MIAASSAGLHGIERRGASWAAEARHAGRVLASAWRVCGRGGWLAAGLFGTLLAAAAALGLLPSGVG